MSRICNFLSILGGDFVFEMEGRTRPVRGEMVICDHLTGLREPLGGLGMGAEVSCQPGYCDFA